MALGFSPAKVDPARSRSTAGYFSRSARFDTELSGDMELNRLSLEDDDLDLFVRGTESDDESESVTNMLGISRPAATLAYDRTGPSWLAVVLSTESLRLCNSLLTSCSSFRVPSRSSWSSLCSFAHACRSSSKALRCS